MASLFALLRNDWQKNYRYHGGLKAMVRCATGHRSLLRPSGRLERGSFSALECAVFSVVPEMSALWAGLFERVMETQNPRIFLGDCSGGLRGRSEFCVAVPMLNIHHGEKLDLFFEHLLQADVVLVTDDDIFWLDQRPLVWAFEQLEKDPRVAVVGLAPKTVLSSVLRGRVERAMGSVLVVRRKIWRDENLSFSVVHPPASEGVKWFYDTGEFAQVELARRGYRVKIAPDELRRDFVFFEGVSSWTLKIQKHEGNLRNLIEGVPVRQEKALQTVFVLESLGVLLTELLDKDTCLVAPDLLLRSRSLCEELLPSDRVEEIHSTIQSSFDGIRELVSKNDWGVPLAETIRRMLGSPAQ